MDKGRIEEPRKIEDEEVKNLDLVKALNHIIELNHEIRQLRNENLKLYELSQHCLKYIEQMDKMEAANLKKISEMVHGDPQ